MDDLIQIKAQMTHRSLSPVWSVVFEQRARKHANMTTSFCNDADKLGATFDRI
ncbi:hypothetical protein [Bradyrhizobium cenepequi]